MKVNLCQSCLHLHPALLTREERIKKHCTHPCLVDMFGKAHGFPSGIDIIHCDYHSQYPACYGDVELVKKETGEVTSYVLTQPRQFEERQGRIINYFDNSKNIKEITL